MKKSRNLIICFFAIFLFSSCGTIKEGFSMQKKDNTDEFLVEKKNPLKLPPDFDELPKPSEDKLNENQTKDELEKLITKNKDNDENTSNEKENTGKSLEELLLGKITEN
tara:strand:+ start:56 stop:382 length:327 start_codon:yes stop_codon:yes gene_type:complete